MEPILRGSGFTEPRGEVGIRDKEVTLGLNITGSLNQIRAEKC